MKIYELLLLLSPELGEEERQKILDMINTVIEREGGTVTEWDHWGLKTLAYPVQKFTRGYYVRIQFNAPGTLVKELERNIRIAEGIFKFVTVKLADKVA